MASPEKIILTTDDNKQIAAVFYSASNPTRWLILTHMMPATKESWDGFAKEMQNEGYASIAIDLRGHGASEGGPSGYKKFNNAEHQAGIKDLEAAWKFLRTRGAEPGITAVIGASIGANLSLQFLAEHPTVTKAVLLSAGLDYRGIAAKPLAKKIGLRQLILLTTSKDDDDNAADNKAIFDILPATSNKHLIVFDNGGHGNMMLSAVDEMDLTDVIKKFLENGSVN